MRSVKIDFHKHILSGQYSPMKRAATAQPRGKKVRGVTDYRSRTYFSWLPDEMFCLIENELSAPWKFTLHRALTGDSSKQDFRADTCEIVKHGMAITQYFVEHKLICLKYVNRFACFYGHQDLYNWAKDQLYDKRFNKSYYIYAIAGGQIEMVRYLLLQKVPFEYRKIMNVTIFTGQLEILKLFSGQFNAFDREYACNCGRFEIYQYLCGVLNTRPNLMHVLDTVRILSPDLQLWSSSGVDDPKEITNYFDHSQIIQRKRQFLEYFKEQGLTMDSSLYNQIDDPHMILLLQEMGYTIDLPHLRSWLTKKVASEDFWYRILLTAHTDDDLKHHLMRFAMEHGYVRVVDELRRRNFPWIPL